MPAHIDFQLRPNKSVERKLIFNALDKLPFAFGQYRYIGLGSYWFSDFMMAHRRLGITDLISIEMDPEIATRARANAPYSGVTVVEGRSTMRLPEVLGQSPRCFLWLDYLGGADAVVIQDLSLVLDAATVGSIVLITVNAQREKLGASHEREAAMRNLFPEVPTPLPAGYFQTDPEAFPANLGALLLARMKKAIASRVGHEFIPLFNMYYRDSTPMVTIGGIVADEAVGLEVKKSVVAEQRGVTGEEQFVIDVPTLTRREKLVLDRLMPRKQADCTLEEFQGAGLPGLKTEVDAAVYSRLLGEYAALYKEYPSYSEIDTW